MRKHTPETPPESLFDGKRCNTCGDWKSLTEFYKRAETPDGRRYDCKTCYWKREKVRRQNAPEYMARQAELIRQWRERNPNYAKEHAERYKERRKEIDQRRYWSNPQYHRVRSTQWKKANWESYLAWMREYRKRRTDYFRGIEQARRPRQRELSRLRWANNPEKYRAKQRDDRRQHPERYRDQDRNHAVRRRAAKAGCTAHHTQSEWQAVCAEFNHRCAYCGQFRTLTRDHVIPLSRGGADTIDNIVPACRSCNSKKHDKLDFRPPKEE